MSDNRLDFYRSEVNKYLEGLFITDKEDPVCGLNEAMRYSLLAGGKRIRPVLALEFAFLCGADYADVLPVACALEMLHTYSLIHDDLPCMDNDDLRRGKPTNHKVFGECTAVLAGDTLQAEAFLAILKSGLPDDRKLKCAKYLAEAVGIGGMCGGQYIDTCFVSENKNAELLNLINSKKTGALLSAACRIGAAAGGGTEEQLEAAASFGALIGEAFQIRDDILDVISSEAELGKTIGSDEKDNKLTYMSLFGEEKCMSLIKSLTDKAKEAVKSCFQDTEALCGLADSMMWRGN